MTIGVVGSAEIIQIFESLQISGCSSVSICLFTNASRFIFTKADGKYYQ